MCKLPTCTPSIPCHYCQRQAEKAKPKPIKPRSAKRAKQEKEYREKTRPEKLRRNPTCEAKLNGCTVVATECHHGSGRIGDLLNDMDNLLSVCRNCHNIIESEPIEAKELKLSKNRIK